MGAEPYYYIVKYQPAIDVALAELRDREFQAGRYNPVMPLIDFPITAESPAPGAEHESPDEALMAAEEDGTRSILDVQALSDAPGFCVAGPLPDDELEELFGAARPTRAQVEANPDYFERLERGFALYVILYKNNRPDEILFAGMSFD